MINISKKQTKLQNFSFINYVYFFVVLLVLIRNSLTDDSIIVKSFISLFNHNTTSISDFLIVAGELIIVPMILFLFGLTVYSKISSSSANEFLKSRIQILGKLFLLSAFVVMPISSYYSNANMLSGGLWEYITSSYFTTWDIGVAWLFSTVLIFDAIIFALFKYCGNLMKKLIEVTKKSSVLKLALAYIFITFIALLFTNITGKAKFTLLTNATSNWNHIGPIWWQKGVVFTYFAIYFFSVLLGSSEKFINYIFSDKGELSSKWLHRILETVILYLIIKFLEPKVPLFGSDVITTAIFSLMFILMAFVIGATFFSLLDRFAYRKSKLLSFFSKHSLMIYTVHLLPLAIIKKYADGFDMTALQKTYTLVIFTFFISLLLSAVIQKFVAVANEKE